MLAKRDVAEYLLDAGLFERDSVPNGGLQVADISRRNRVFVVSCDGNSGYVVKQPESPSHDFLAREAAVLDQLAAVEPRLVGFMPTPVFHDPVEHILVCELVGDALDLAAYHARGRFPPTLARAVGIALARLHDVSPEALQGLPAGREQPLHRNPAPLDLVVGMSDASVQLLTVMQKSAELCDRLAEVVSSERPSAVIHGDARPSNCVAYPSPGSRRRTRIALVDWESARRGDPHVDLGTVLGEFLQTWVWSMWVLDGRDIASAARYARHPLRDMQPAIRAFWLAYVSSRRDRKPSVRLAIEYAAVQLVEVAFERAQSQSALDPRAGVALQLGLNILRRPAQAAVELLGFTTIEAA